ncbi:MAG: hypothetical protein CME10_15625 [Gemmatimonadetes bacterium]|nr:hypothetical protein [Gemmatimonadota bacterium]
MVDEGIFDQLELLHLNVFTATSSDYIYLRIVCFFFRTGELLYFCLTEGFSSNLQTKEEERCAGTTREFFASLEIV